MKVKLDEAAPALEGVRSRKTGRLRGILWDKKIAFTVGNDGIARPTWWGGQLLHASLPFGEKAVIVKSDAVPFVAEGRSLFSQFVDRADANLSPDSSAVIVDADNHLLAVGRLLLSPAEMRGFGRGVAVRVTAHAHQGVRSKTVSATRSGS